MIASTSIFTSRRNWGFAVVALAILATGVLWHPLASVAALGLALVARHVFRAPTLGLQPPGATRNGDLYPGGLDPMASNRLQPAPPPSRPMGPAGLHTRA